MDNRYVFFSRHGIGWIILFRLIKYDIVSANNLLLLRDPYMPDIRYNKANKIANQSM